MKIDKISFGLLLVCSCCFSGIQAQSNKTIKENEDISDASVATAWTEFTVQLMTKAPQNTPTYGSRALGYIGLTMYETVVHSSPKHRSVAKILCDTLLLPQPPSKKAYCRELALNAGQAYILKAFYGYTNKTTSIDSLEAAIRQQYAARVTTEAAASSAAYGQAVAARIYQWSKSDNGHEAYKRNFPNEYIRPIGEGLWVPPVVGQSNTKIPMHPAWGQNRTFSVQNAGLPMPKPLVYSEDSASEYYKQYKEVFDRGKTLTNADRAIVMWWGDDPTETCSPPGHSYHLATIAIRNGKAGLVKAAETYAKVGMAVADAFICCWKAKFAYMVERPSSFINKKFHRHANFQGLWLPFFLEPPFPSFYSGHAVQSAATATVLTELYGESFAFTDDTHVNRPPKKYQIRKPLPDNFDPTNYEYHMPEYTHYEMIYLPRYYHSFWEAARECANSRLMGGIHTRYDNEVGLKEGTEIGKNINAIRWN